MCQNAQKRALSTLFPGSQRNIKTSQISQRLLGTVSVCKMSFMVGAGENMYIYVLEVLSLGIGVDSPIFNLFPFCRAACKLI